MLTFHHQSNYQISISNRFQLIQYDPQHHFPQPRRWWLAECAVSPRRICSKIANSLARCVNGTKRPGSSCWSFNFGSLLNGTPWFHNTIFCLNQCWINLRSHILIQWSQWLNIASSRVCYQLWTNVQHDTKFTARTYDVMSENWAEAHPAPSSFWWQVGELCQVHKIDCWGQIRATHLHDSAFNLGDHRWQRPCCELSLPFLWRELLGVTERQ